MEARIRRHYDAIASGKSRRTSQQSVSSSNDGSTELAERPLFPFPSSYPAHLAIHNTLILASFFLSPRFIALEPLPEQLRNLDRPQHPFLAQLTARPDLTALWVALGNALLIPWFAGSVREWFREGKMGLGMKERVQDENKSADIWNATAFTGYATIAYSLLIVLLGAPVVTHVTHTLLLALNLALMTIFIPAYAFGVPQLPMGLPFISPIRQGRSSGSALALNDIYVRLFAEYKLRTPLERAVVYPVIYALLGAWAGVIPIGLDWDRPWQAYPLTPLFGATVGYVIGSVGALIVSVTYFFAAHDVSQSTARDTTAKKISDSKKGKKAKNI